MTDLEAMVRAIVRDELQQADVGGAPARAVTVREAAERLAVDPKTIRRLIQNGELRAVRVGSRSVRIPASDINAFVAQSEVMR